MTTLARELRHWRKTFDLTQEQAAEVLQVSAGHISRIERGAHLPPVNEQRRMESLINAMFVGAEAQRDWSPL
jgi:transcriptional regulator with XRE-family HTH domain